MTLTLAQPKTTPSPLSRWDPRWKLAALLPAAVVVALLRTLPAAAAALLLAWSLVLLGRVPLRWYLLRTGILVLFLLLFVAWLPFLPAPGPGWQIGAVPVSAAGLYLAVMVLLKAVAIVTLMMVLWVTGPLEATLKAAQALRLPGLFVHIIFLTYRYLFLLAEEFGRLRVALRVRGFRNRGNRHSYRIVGHVSGMLLVRSYERAERVAAAMRARGFDGRFRCLTACHTRPADVAAFFSLIVPIMGLLLWDLWRR